MDIGISRELMAYLGVVGILMAVGVMFIIHQLRIIFARSLTFQKVLRYCENGVSVIDFKQSAPDSQLFCMQNHVVHIFYARIKYDSGLDELLEARYLYSDHKIKLVFRNSELFRINNHLAIPGNKPFNCSAMYELRIMAEKIAQEYLRLRQFESSS